MSLLKVKEMGCWRGEMIHASLVHGLQTLQLNLFSLGQMGDRQRDLESEEGCLFYGAHQKFQMVRL